MIMTMLVQMASFPHHVSRAYFHVTLDVTLDFDAIKLLANHNLWRAPHDSTVLSYSVHPLAWPRVHGTFEPQFSKRHQSLPQLLTRRL